MNKEVLNQTRWIWAVVYAFLTGFNSGIGHWSGAVMIAIGAVAIFWWTSRMMERLCQQTAMRASTVTVKIEADTEQAEAAIEKLRNSALRAKRDIDAAYGKDL